MNTFVIRYGTALVISAFHLMAAREREHSVYGMDGSASCCAPPDYQNTTLSMGGSLHNLSFSPCFSSQVRTQNAGQQIAGAFPTSASCLESISPPVAFSDQIWGWTWELFMCWKTFSTSCQRLTSTGEINSRKAMVS